MCALYSSVLVYVMLCFYLRMEGMLLARVRMCLLVIVLVLERLRYVKCCFNCDVLVLSVVL